MASGGSSLTSDEIVNIKCCVCTEENRTREAEKYCVQCKDYYCSSCIDIHKRVPSLKGHTLLDRADFTTSGQDGSLPSFPTERCTVHQSEVVNTYCKDHDEVVCALCVVVNHRTCADIQTISADIDNLYNDIEITSVKKKLTETIEAIKTWKTATEIKTDTLKRSLAEAEDTVKSFRETIEALLDEMEHKTLNELRGKFKKISQSLKGRIEEMEIMIKCLNDARDKVNKAVGNRAQEFVSVKMSHKEISKGEKLQKELNHHQQQQEESITFIPDKHVKESLQAFQTFGKAFKLKDTLYQVKAAKEIHAKLPSDNSTCRLFGSCMTDDDCLLVADIDNMKLKRLIMSTAIIKDYLDFAAGPKAVCQASRIEAAVTLRNKTVHFISLGDKMAVTRSLQMDHCCCGIAYTGGKLFISDEGKTVYVHDMEGILLQTISSDAAGRDIFQSTKQISVSAGGDRIFVADSEEGLVILDIHGNYMSTFDSEKAGRCFHTCTDGRNVFISCYNSGKILQLSPNYLSLGEIRSFSYPLSVAYDRLRNRLLVTTYQTNSITVLDLQ